MSALILTAPDGEKRTIPIHDDRLFLENFEVICRLSKIKTHDVLFVIDGKVYRYG